MSDNWGIGLALVGQYGKMKDKEVNGVKYDIDYYYIGVALTATYN